MASEATIGALRVVLGADIAKFEDGLKKAESGLSAFGKRMTEVAGGIKLAQAFDKIFDAVNRAIFGTIDAIDSMGKAAQKFGVPIEQFSLLSRAASLSDVSMEQLGASLGRLSKNMVAVAGGATDQAAAAFQALGISVKTASGQIKSADQVLLEVADRFSKFQDGATKTALAIALFGKSGAEMIPFLNEGADAIKTMTDRFRAMGLVITQETFQAAQTFNDNLKEIGFAADAVVLRVLGSAGLLDALVRISDVMKITANDGDRLATVGNAIGEALKVIAFWADTAWKALIALAQPFTAIVAAAANLAQGNLQGALDAITTRFVGMKDSLVDVKKSFDTLFGVPDIFDETNRTLERSLQLFEQFKVMGPPPQFDPKQFQHAKKAQQDMLALQKQMFDEQQSILEKFQTPAEKLAEEVEKINSAFARGILTQEQFGLVSQRVAQKISEFYAEASSKIAGDFASGFKALAAENKKFGLLAKAAAIAQAVINTYQGATKALASLPPPLSYVAAAATIVAGLGHVATIKAQSFATGGSFRVGGSGGIDSQMVQFMATPGEMVDVRTPGTTSSGKVQTIELRTPRVRDFFTENVRELVDALNRAAPDGYILKMPA